MEKNQIPSPKASLWITLAPFICLLPLNTASALLQDISTPVKLKFPRFVEKDGVTIGFTGLFLSLIIGHKCFQSRVNFSVKYAILAEILLTSALIIGQIMTIALQQHRSRGPHFLFGLVGFSFGIYSSLWPLFKLQYNLYLHQCSQKKFNKGFIYASGICMQILPSLLGKMIGRLFHHENDEVTIKTNFSSILTFQMFVTFLAFLASLALCKKTFSLLPKITSLKTEGQESFSDSKFDSKIYLYFIILGAFAWINRTKSHFLLPIQYSTEPSIYTLNFIFDVGLKDPIFLACFVHVLRVFVVFCTGKLLDQYNKTKIFYLIMAGLFGTMILRNFFGYFSDGAAGLGFYFPILWGFCDLIQLAIHAIISADENGSPELFFVSGVFFCFGDLVRRTVSERNYYEWVVISFYMVMQTITIMLFVYLKRTPASTTKKSEIKMKL